MWDARWRVAYEDDHHDEHLRSQDRRAVRVSARHRRSIDPNPVLRSMKRFITYVSDDGLFTQVEDRKLDTTATIPNSSDAWKEAIGLLPAIFPRYPRYAIRNLIRMGWYQRRHRLLP